MDYDELVNEYIRLHKKTFTIRTPRPKHIPMGASWTTKEMLDITNRMEEIIEEVGLEAQREFYKEVDRRLQDE